MICQECGKEFKKTNPKGWRKFCSRKCGNKNWHKKNKKYVYEYNSSKKIRDKINKNRREKYAIDENYRNEIKKKAKKYYQKNPCIKKRSRLRKYNLSIEDYEILLKKQNYKCAICGYSDLNNKQFFPMVDHCHITKKVRGLLCLNCNHGIGKFKDDIELLKNAIKYLRKNK